MDERASQRVSQGRPIRFKGSAISVLAALFSLHVPRPLFLFLLDQLVTVEPRIEHFLRITAFDRFYLAADLDRFARPAPLLFPREAITRLIGL